MFKDSYLGLQKVGWRNKPISILDQNDEAKIQKNLKEVVKKYEEEDLIKLSEGK